MINIFVATHGKMAEGVISAINIIMGNTDGIKFINGYVDDDDIRRVSKMVKQMELSDLDISYGKMFLESSHLKTEEISKRCLKKSYLSKKTEYAVLYMNIQKTRPARWIWKSAVESLNIISF